MKEMHSEEFMACEVCGKVTSSYQIHHIKTKGSGGDEAKSNYAILCWVCHDLIHNCSKQFIEKFGINIYNKFLKGGIKC